MLWFHHVSNDVGCPLPLLCIYFYWYIFHTSVVIVVCFYRSFDLCRCFSSVPVVLLIFAVVSYLSLSFFRFYMATLTTCLLLFWSENVLFLHQLLRCKIAKSSQILTISGTETFLEPWQQSKCAFICVIK